MLFTLSIVSAKMCRGRCRPMCGRFIMMWRLFSLRCQPSSPSSGAVFFSASSFHFDVASHLLLLMIRRMWTLFRCKDDAAAAFIVMTFRCEPIIDSSLFDADIFAGIDTWLRCELRADYFHFFRRRLDNMWCADTNIFIDGTFSADAAGQMMQPCLIFQTWGMI